MPLAKKQSAVLEITVAKDVPPDVYRFRVETPLGTTNMVPLAIGSLPEVKKSEKSENAAQPVMLPATMVGTITAPGDKDRYEFDGKTGEDVVFEVVASKVGSRLESLLALSDSSGRVLAEAGRRDNSPDATLHYRLPQDGKYTSPSQTAKGVEERKLLSPGCGRVALHYELLPTGRARGRNHGGGRRGRESRGGFAN